MRAPTRIDLGGGWTDVPPYCTEEGGFVCNLAITRYAVATVHASETYRAPAGTAPDETHADPLIGATLRRSGIPGVDLSLASDFPVSAGLGGSSAASAALLGALARWRGEEWNLAAIAEEGRRIEVEEMGIAGGRQDHYAATHGGALALTFTDAVRVRRLTVSSGMRAEFERRALLVYTGESRVSGSTITAVLDAWRAGDAGVVDALRAMKAIARQMVVALEAGDLTALGALLGEHWEYQRSLHPAIPTARIDEVIVRAQAAGAIGWKAMGASAGGCVLVITGAENGGAVRRAVERLGEIVPFALDDAGLADQPG